MSYIEVFQNQEYPKFHCAKLILNNKKKKSLKLDILIRKISYHSWNKGANERRNLFQKALINNYILNLFLLSLTYIFNIKPKST